MRFRSWRRRDEANIRHRWRAWVCAVFRYLYLSLSPCISSLFGFGLTLFLILSCNIT